MPDPVEYLKKAYHAATGPLVPKSWVDPMANAIDAPALDRSPMEARLRGFGAGALEGLREQTSPLNLALAALPYVRGAAYGARGAAAGAGAMKAAAPTMDVIEDVGTVAQKMPTMSEVDALAGDLARNLAKIRPRAAAPPATALPEFAAVGEEAATNAARAGGQAPAGYGDTFYREMMRRFGGRGPM